MTHDELDWAPLAGADTPFLNLMTARLESAALELLDLAARRIKAGQWPWSFFCYPEERPGPSRPSAFRVLGGGGEELGLAVECPLCAHTSVNVVSRDHVDVPFYNDAPGRRRRARLQPGPRAGALGVPRRARVEPLRREPARPRG